jgi:hypothetical protein
VGLLRDQLAFADGPRRGGQVVDVGYHHIPLRYRPGGVPEGALLVGAALFGVGVQYRFGDHGRLVALRSLHAQRLDDALTDKLVDGLVGNG